MHIYVGLKKKKKESCYKLQLLIKLKIKFPIQVLYYWKMSNLWKVRKLLLSLNLLNVHCIILASFMFILLPYTNKQLIRTSP